METKKMVVPNDIMLGAVSDLLREGRSVQMSVKGNSMSPFIRNGRDSVELKLEPVVGKGDIVLAEIQPGNYVIHRVAAIDGDAVTLKGDGNLDATEHCSRENIRGTVKRIIKPGRKGFDCGSKSFRRMSERWCSAPRIVRRYFLGIYRRVKFI